MTWTKTYRPTRLDDIVGHTEEIAQIRALIRKEPVPHLGFYGTPGTGKTSCAHAIANELDADVVEINASDLRGIDAVRATVIPAMRTSWGGKRFIILDEADYLTSEAQAMLRRPLEQYTTNTVIACCNSIGSLMMALGSRLTLIEFKPLTSVEIKEALNRILEAEGIDNAPLDAIVKQSKGDLRMATNILERITATGTPTLPVNDEQMKAVLSALNGG